MGKFVVRNTATGIKFDLKATNGQVIATSEVYKSKASCLAGVKSVSKNAPVANVEDQTVSGLVTNLSKNIMEEAFPYLNITKAE